LSCGMNDVLAGFDWQESAAALDTIFGWARGTGATTVVSTLPIPPVLRLPILSEVRKMHMLDRVREFNDMLVYSAERHAIKYADESVLPDINTPWLWSADAIHLDTAGHVYITDEIEKFLINEVGFVPEQ